MSNEWCAPIPSRIVEDKIEAHLKRSSLSYGALYRFCITTGMLINKALELKVGDVKENGEIKTSFTIKDFSANVPEYKIVLDSHTQDILRELCGDRTDDKFLFTAKDDVSRLHRSTFQKKLKSISEKFGLSHITPKSLRKTHILHIYQIYGLQRAAYIAGQPNVGTVIAYLGIDNRLSSQPCRERKFLIENENGKKIIEDIISSLKAIEDNLNNPINPDIYYIDLSKDLERIRIDLEEYTKNNPS